jgi:AraC-like DNA-binding protein
MKQLMFSKEFLLSETQGELACWECMFESVVVPLQDDAQLKQLNTYVQLMELEFNERRPQQEIILRNLLNAFIISAARNIRRKGCVRQMDSNQNKIVRQFKGLADQHFLNTTQVAQYADMLYVTPGHLNDLIKSVTGKTAKQIIDEKRVMEAKRLLFWGEHTVKQIAGLLNFEDDAYFNRFFKKHTGQTPALFQKTTREKYNNSPNLVNPILVKAS